ncbi:MAG: LapA family protein [Deltaproteobacteria bacterium]|nr:LapA family protein [Deltaproteobacteria bacterium]
MKQIKVLVVILFLLLIVVLSVQNYAALSTTINFRANLLFLNYQTADLSIFLIAVVAFLFGVMVIWFFGLSERFSFKRQIKALMKDVKSNEMELNSLRNLPVITEDISSGGDVSPVSPPVNA